LGEQGDLLLQATGFQLGAQLLESLGEASLDILP